MNQTFSKFYNSLSSEVNSPSYKIRDVCSSYKKLERGYQVADPDTSKNISTLIIIIIRHYYLLNGGDVANLAPFNPDSGCMKLEYRSELLPHDLNQLICVFIDRCIHVTRGSFH